MQRYNNVSGKILHLDISYSVRFAAVHKFIHLPLGVFMFVFFLENIRLQKL